MNWNIPSSRRWNTVELDPLSSADVYNGESHGKKATTVHTFSIITVPLLSCGSLIWIAQKIDFT
jgi:hypothetical protein